MHLEGQQQINLPMTVKFATSDDTAVSDCDEHLIIVLLFSMVARTIIVRLLIFRVSSSLRSFSVFGNTNPLSMKLSLVLKPIGVLSITQDVVDPLPLQKKVAFVPSGTACDSGGTRISAAEEKP